jgi:hypothetical protein
MARPTSWAGSSAWPLHRSASSTSWPRRASWSSVTGRPLHALRTPLIALSRLNGSVAPERLLTINCICSTVEKRRSQAGQARRRRIALPSSATRESSTRVSVLRQCGQCMTRLLPGCGRASAPGSGVASKARGGPAWTVDPELSSVDNQQRCGDAHAQFCELDVENHNGVTTRCSGNRTSLPPVVQAPSQPISGRTGPTTRARMQTCRSARKARSENRGFGLSVPRVSRDSGRVAGHHPRLPRA